MKECGKRWLLAGGLWIAGFIIWTMLVQIVDVQPVGQNGTVVGFATLNVWFHRFTGVHMMLYTITDWLGLIPVAVCVLFGGVGLAQVVKRKSLRKVDVDIVLLGIYYVVVIFCYLIFEMIPINYRPILIDGRMEASYPSSTTLLVLSVMPTLIFQVNRRVKNALAGKIISVLSGVFTIFMVIGRLISGVHWLTDIVGSVMISAGVFYLYKGLVMRCLARGHFVSNRHQSE